MLNETTIRVVYSNQQWSIVSNVPYLKPLRAAEKQICSFLFGIKLDFYLANYTVRQSRNLNIR